MLPTPTPDDAGDASFRGPSRDPNQKADMGCVSACVGGWAGVARESGVGVCVCVSLCVGACVGGCACVSARACPRVCLCARACVRAGGR